MPHFPHTPEALLRRNDSKDASRTCRGITSSGRACRRALALPKSPAPVRRAFQSSLTERRGPAECYCWQHQDQAEQEDAQKTASGRGDKRERPSTTKLEPLKEQSSIDTLVQKLGINNSETDGPRRTPNDVSSGEPKAAQLTSPEKTRRKKSSGFWAALCCMASNTSNDDYVEIVRHRKRVQQMQGSAQLPPARSSIPNRPPMAQVNMHHQRLGINVNPRQPLVRHPTEHLLSLIPSSLSPSTTSALLTELAKPISPYDEDGYIYIFWLTPQSKERPGDSTARSLLSPPDARPANIRSISDVMTEYSFKEQNVSLDPERNTQRRGGKRSIMLKIGRASNITRRLNEWQRQCGYALNLVRWYPHVSSQSSPGSRHPRSCPQHRASEPLYPDLSRSSNSEDQSDHVLKCPHVHRVERLIHLELAAKQVRRQCTACGKEHREWFEVQATQAGIQAVDETIRRWVGWAERQRQSDGSEVIH